MKNSDRMSDGMSGSSDRDSMHGMQSSGSRTGSRQQSGGMSQAKEDSLRAASSSDSSSDESSSADSSSAESSRSASSRSPSSREQSLPQHEELQNRPDVGMRGRSTRSAGRGSGDAGMR